MDEGLFTIDPKYKHGAARAKITLALMDYAEAKARGDCDTTHAIRRELFDLFEGRDVQGGE